MTNPWIHAWTEREQKEIEELEQAVAQRRAKHEDEMRQLEDLWRRKADELKRKQMQQLQ